MTLKKHGFAFSVMPGVGNFGACEYSEQIRENACQRETAMLHLIPFQRICTFFSVICQQSSTLKNQIGYV